MMVVAALSLALLKGSSLVYRQQYALPAHLQDTFLRHHLLPIVFLRTFLSADCIT